jgi:hypothetical protein
MLTTPVAPAQGRRETARGGAPMLVKVLARHQYWPRRDNCLPVEGLIRWDQTPARCKRR